MSKIETIQKQIVAKIEAGEDVSELTKQLAQERAEIVSQAEVAELTKIASERQALRDRAAAVKAKVEAQDLGINRFLKLRDTLTSQLSPLLEPMGELAKMAAPGWEREPGECYSGYNDLTQFAGDVRGIPSQYLSKDFGCPFLSMAGGKEDALRKTDEAYTYLQWACGILTSLYKGISIMGQPPAEGLIAIDETETTEVESSCRVCNHEKAAEINKLLKDGKSLRAIGDEFNVSRSTLHRHKTNCLNLGIVRIHK